MLVHGFTIATSKGVGLHTALTFTYNSKSNFNGTAGKGWAWVGDALLTELGNGNVVIRGEDGTLPTFVYDALTDTYTTPTGCGCGPVTLEKVSTTVFTLTSQTAGNCSGVWRTTFTNGVISEKEDVFGNAMQFSYTSGLLTSITDTRGITAVTIAYYNTNRAETFTTSDGAVWTFSYNPKDQLMYVDHPATTSLPNGIHEEYRYINGLTNQSLNDNMIAAIDGTGTTTMTVEYDTSDRVTKQCLSGNDPTFDYTQIGSQTTTVTDAVGCCGLRPWLVRADRPDGRAHDRRRAARGRPRAATAGGAPGRRSAREHFEEVPELTPEREVRVPGWCGIGQQRLDVLLQPLA
jgi:hypothetical protein